MHVERRGSGPDVVLVHGWAMHSGVFEPLVRGLESRFTLHLVDLPGHGRSPERDGPLDLARAAERLVDAVPRATWLGWSMGGLVCLEAARRAPERLDALALVATSPCFVKSADWPHGVEHAVFEQFGADLAADYQRTLERFLALEVHGSDCARAELRALRASAFDRGEPAVHVLEDGLRILADTDLRGALPTISVRTALIAGARDRLVPWRAMEWAAHAMPDATFARIAGGGHAPFIGHPDRVLAALEPLLAQVPA